MKVALLCDYPAEGWLSMDLVAEMIAGHLDPREFEVKLICPSFRKRAMRVPGLHRTAPGFAWNVDRLLNRMGDYPRALRAMNKNQHFDLFHVVDHSYSQLVHALPPGRTVVTCHDLETFRYVLEPKRYPRPIWFRAMTRRIITGLASAAAVVCDSETTRDALAALQWVSPEKLHVVHLGVHPECSPSPDAQADLRVEQWLGPSEGGPRYLLHVGSNIERKRIDVLLAVFAELVRTDPDLRLIKVGGELTSAQERQARGLGIRDRVLTLPVFSPKVPSDRAALAAIYRRSSLVLLPSEVEGFGLPVVEALACGVPILASDIPVLKEVGGETAEYRAIGDIAGWVEAVNGLLAEPEGIRESRRLRGIQHASFFSWAAHTERLAVIYRLVAASLETTFP